MASAPRSHRRPPARLILALLTVIAVTGCGGDDGSPQPSSDQDQIRVAVERLLESESVENQCETAVTARFVREVYSSLARCRAANRPDDEDDEPDSAAISATRIEGDRATTAVTLTSVNGARATGRLALVRVAGTWKVDRLGVDFLRSIFEALPKEAETAQERVILRCLAEASRRLSRRALRRFGNEVVGQRLKPEGFPPGALSCIRRSERPGPTI